MTTFITIPLRLQSEANSSEHWSKKAKRHKQQKMVVRAYMQWQTCDLPCTITLTRAAPRPFDSDNLQSAFKYIRDTIAAYIIGNDIPGIADSDIRITWKYEQKKTKDKEHYITIQIDSCIPQSFQMPEV